MHRKIPKSTRHKKLKAIDPFYKGERKQLIDKKASRANEKPVDASVQEIPRSLRELMKVRELMKDGKYTRASQKKRHQAGVFNEGDDYGPGVKGCDRKPQTIPVFKQKSQESDKSFAKRMKRMTEDIMEGSKIEDKFDADFDVDVNESDNPTDDDDDDIPDLKIPKGRKPRSDKKLAKRKIFQEKEKEKKRLKAEERALDREEIMRDYIPFGEVVMAPPMLTVVPRKGEKQNPAERRPGAQPLLLTKLMESHKTAPQAAVQPLGRADLTVKRKHLPNAERRMLDQERDAAILAYRELKKNRNSK